MPDGHLISEEQIAKMSVGFVRANLTLPVVTSLASSFKDDMT